MAVHLSFSLILTGLTGIYCLESVNDVSVKVGQSITIPCHYESKYVNNVKYLCKGFQWLRCSAVIKTNKEQHLEKFSISDDKTQRTFTVTIKDLKDDDADYWCIVEIDNSKDSGHYFHLSVTTGTPSLYVDQQEITGLNGENITINCYCNYSGEMKWCRLDHKCVTGSGGLINGTRVTINENVPNVFTVTMSGLTTENSGWYYCVKGALQMPVHLTVSEQITTITPTVKPVTLTSAVKPSASVYLRTFIIPAGVLIFIVAVALFVWFTLKRNKQTAASSAPAAAEEGVTYTTVNCVIKPQQVKEDVTYGNHQISNTSYKSSASNSDMWVLYSSVATGKQKTQQRVNSKTNLTTDQPFYTF